MGISMPQCNQGADDFLCKDCGNDFSNSPRMFLEDVEFCRDCMASWTAELRDVELVYLIVPGLRRAQVGDKVSVRRLGEAAAMNAAYDAMPTVPSRHYGPTFIRAYGQRPAMTLCGKSMARFRTLRLTKVTDSESSHA